ncbi:hypothetical protein LY76DRAFT_28833 [Colletotrichum caudatum]|nr:hypothetical protein LY76DRAFT_28833 [Colletotrichum caudatum]
MQHRSLAFMTTIIIHFSMRITWGYAVLPTCPPWSHQRAALNTNDPYAAACFLSARLGSPFSHSGLGMELGGGSKPRCLNTYGSRLDLLCGRSTPWRFDETFFTARLR